MFIQAQHFQHVHAFATVLPAVRQITLEHRVEVGDLAPIVQYSGFVPSGREVTYARGLLAGLQGDFLVAIHLLIPQVEHSIRALLTNAGVITSSLTTEGIQNEYNVNQTLVEDKFTGPLEQILGKDLIFDLRCLLIEHGGSNLRNRMAHGLVDDGEWNSVACVYLWWLVLRLCCLPLIITAASRPQAVDNEEPGETSGDEGFSGEQGVTAEQGPPCTATEDHVEL